MARFRVVQDESCHWYIIPENKKDEWDEWAVSDDAMDGVVPDWAEEANMHVSFLTFKDPKWEK